MLSDKIIRLIRLRLAIIKYSGCSVIHWDMEKDRVVPTHNYIYWTWCNSYYSGIVFTPVLMAILYFYMEDENERMNGGDSSGPDDVAGGRSMKNLAMSLLLVITAVIVFCSLVVSILKAARREICAFYYACFQLDRTIKASFRTRQAASPEYLDAVSKSSQKYEFIMVLVCVITMLPPFILFVSIFHPADPMNTLLHDGFDMTVKPTPRFFVVSFIYAWSGFAMVNTFITFMLTTVLAMTSCTVWTFATMPVRALSSSRFETEQLGELHCDQIFKIYRYHQILCNYLNAFIGKFRVSLHFGLLHMVFIAGSYILIRNFDMFLAQGAYELICIFTAFIFVALIICKVECVFIGTMVDVSATMKQNCLNLSVGRKHYAYKTARSFQILLAKTTYPLFTVGNETYLEFWDVSVDHIVNLLCS